MNEDGSDRFLRGEVSNKFKDIEREPVFGRQLSEKNEEFDYVKDGRRDYLVKLEKELSKDTSTPKRGEHSSTGFIISSLGVDGYKKAERIRTAQ